MAQAQTHPHLSTWNGRKFYGDQIDLPTGVQEADASNSAELQSKINNPANIIINVDGHCDASTVKILAAHSGSGQRRYIVGKAGGLLAKLVLFGAFNWAFTADGTTTDWLNFGTGKGDFDYQGKHYAAGTVFGSISCVDVKDVVVDRWRYRGAGGFLSYYNTDGKVVENLVVQRGNHRNDDTANPREAVLISRPAWNGEMIGGSGSTSSTNKWAVRSVDVRIVNNVSANAPDFYQNTGNGHVPASDDWPAWAAGKQTGAESLSDEGLIIAGNQCWVDEWVFDENGLSVRATATENPFDLKNGSLNPDKPVLIFDNVLWGYAPGRGQGDGEGKVAPDHHLVDPGTAINLHYVDSQNVKVYDNAIICCCRGIYSGKGYSKAIYVQHNLFYNGAALLDGTALPRFQTDEGQNAEPFGILMQEHTYGGTQRCDHNHLMYQRVAFAQNVRNGDPAPGCVGNVALGGGTWIGPLAGMSAQNCISDKSGFGTHVGPEVLARAGTLNIEVRDPLNLDDPTATVVLSMPHAVLAEQDAPTNDNRWVIGNEAPPNEGFGGLRLSGASRVTTDATIDFDLSAAGGAEPYVFALQSWDVTSAVVSLSAGVVTVARGDDYGPVTVTVRVTDADLETDTATLVVDFKQPQIPGIVWSANSEPFPDSAPATSVADGDTGLDAGWTGSTAAGPAILMGLWPTPHDVELLRFMEGLDSARTYNRAWQYTINGTDWLEIPGVGTVSALKDSEGEWNDHEPTIQNVVGVRRYATGNSLLNEWQRVNEVELYGVESIGTVNPPVCIAFEATAAPGDVLVLDETQLAALAATNGGNLLEFAVSGHSISPPDAGELTLVDGQLKLVIADDFSGDITLTNVTEAAEV